VRVPRRRRFPVGTEVVVRLIDDQRWVTLEPITYGEWTVPAGTVTDLASVPRVAVWLIARFGRWVPGAIWHDDALEKLVKHGRMSSVECDELFRQALEELDTPPVRAWLMWLGVRWGAAFSSYRRAGWWSTAPRVFALTVYALPHAVFMALLLIPLAYHSLSEAIVTRGRRRGTLST